MKLYQNSQPFKISHIRQQVIDIFAIFHPGWGEAPRAGASELPILANLPDNYSCLHFVLRLSLQTSKYHRT